MPILKTQPLFMSTQEVADLVGISAATLRYWRHEGGKLGPPSFTFGNKMVRYRRSDVMAWVYAEEERTKVGNGQQYQTG